MCATSPGPTRVRIGNKMTAPQALREIALACGADFDAFLVQLMTTADPEAPHGARVALRRLRSALAGFAPLIDKAVLAALKAEARDLFRRLGPLRDADVLGEGLRGAPFAAMDPNAALRAEVRQALIDRDAAGFSARLQQVFLNDNWIRKGGKTPASRIARRAMARAWADCREHGKHIAAMPVPDRHAFRKDLKTLRYLNDFFQELWPGEAAESAFERLRALQDALGTLNDIATIHARATFDPATQAEHDRKQADAMDIADEIWRKLYKTRPWWK